MKINITTPNDVINFGKYLFQTEKVIFHPDDDFSIYKMKNGEPLYSEDESKLRNKLMDDCFEVCKKYDLDIYELFLTISKTSIII